MLKKHNSYERMKAVIIAAAVLAVVFVAVTLPVFFRISGRGESFETAFQTVAIEYNNFIRLSNNMQLFCIVFLLLASRLFVSFSPVLLTRRRSRIDSIKSDVWSLLLFSAEFAAVLECVHVVGITLLFGVSLPSQYDFYLFSLADFVAEWVFYLRVGLLLLLANLLVKRAFAPFLAFAVCFLAFFFCERFSIPFFPFYDSVFVTYLMANVAIPSDLPVAYLRGIVLDGIMIFAVSWLFKEKDVMTV